MHFEMCVALFFHKNDGNIWWKYAWMHVYVAKEKLLHWLSGQKKCGDWERNTNEVKEIDVKSIFR